MIKLKRSLLYLVSFFLNFFDRSATKKISRDHFIEFVDQIRPIRNGHELTRLGNAGDGSYLLPNDFQDIERVISPGIGESRTFEDDCRSKYGISATLLDPYVKPSQLYPEDMYIPKLLTATSTDISTTLNDLVSDERGDLILQMDIESGEYEVLSNASMETLTRFRIMAIEFHRVDLWFEETYFNNLIEPLFQKLLSEFDIIHFHPNTSTGYFNYKNIKLPKFAEITFHRKDRAKNYDGYVNIPNPLDTLTDLNDKSENFYFTHLD